MTDGEQTRVWLGPPAGCERQHVVGEKHITDELAWISWAIHDEPKSLATG
jgi:hypothetical protein